jgi:hypothetical protein
MHLLGIHLIGIHLIGIHLLGIHLIGIHLRGIHLIGIHDIVGLRCKPARYMLEVKTYEGSSLQVAGLQSAGLGLGYRLMI